MSVYVCFGVLGLLFFLFFLGGLLLWVFFYKGSIINTLLYKLKFLLLYNFTDLGRRSGYV